MAASSSKVAATGKGLAAMAAPTVAALAPLLQGGGDYSPVVEGGVAVEGGELGGEAGGFEAGAEGVGVGVALGSGVHPAEQARKAVDAAGGAGARAAVVEAGADDQLRAGLEHRHRGVEDHFLGIGRHELEDIEDRDAAPVRGRAGSEIHAVEGRI